MAPPMVGINYIKSSKVINGVLILRRNRWALDTLLCPRLFKSVNMNTQNTMYCAEYGSTHHNSFLNSELPNMLNMKCLSEF